jgi:hypothetical protein
MRIPGPYNQTVAVFETGCSAAKNVLLPIKSKGLTLYSIHHLLKHLQTQRSAHAVYLRVSYDSQNTQGTNISKQH